MRDTAPLPGKPAFVPPTPSAVAIKPIKAEKPVRLTPATKPVHRPLLVDPAVRTPSVPGLDRRTAQRLGRGALTIDARLDLHGMTQEQAHGALNGFIARAWEHGKRHLLVITGKGGRRAGHESGYGGGQAGILRANVPRWLREEPNRSRVLAVSEAQPRHGGGGALYVLVRRRRD